MHQVEFPPKLVDVLDLSVHVPFRGAYGGRGSAKTKSFARATAYAMHIRDCHVLVAREIQASIKDSSFSEIKDAIQDDVFLNSVFDCGINYIRHKYNNKEYIFRGLKNNIDAIKSLANIGITWVDEADPVSEASWYKLIPTVMRSKNSEIWLTWNPEEQGNATDMRFMVNPPDDSRIVELNYTDNPWFPDGLEKVRLYDLKYKQDLYHHIWEGGYKENSEAEIMSGKWEIDSFEPLDDWKAYYGLDFGFSQDPTAGVECFVNDGILYIRREAGKIGLELNDTKAYLLKRIPNMERSVIRADCARPESISLLKRDGLRRIQPCKKWSGSVEDGIAHIRAYKKVVIHPECKNTIKEFKYYRYKIDKDTDDPTNKIIDDYNHYIDAIRYALGALISKKGYTYNL